MTGDSYITKIADTNSCTGCTACAAICPKDCIKMVKDEYGFSYPCVKDLSECISCGACARVCPVLNTDYTHSTEPKAYAAYSNNDELRMSSSSGGVFSELSEYVLKENGIVFGAAYDKDFNVHHICINKPEDLDLIRRAKYSESSLGDIFRAVRKNLLSGKLVLFAGTPCQVAGLKSFIGKEYNNLITADFICHSIPSPLAWKQYVRYRAEKDHNGEYPVRINQRSKESGWSRYRYSVKFEYDNNDHYSSLSTDDLYLRLFRMNYISRLSCSNCQFKGCKRFSDITLGDFWGIWEVLPKEDSDQGVSAVLVHTQKMEDILESLSDHISMIPVTFEQISTKNKSIIEVSASNPERNTVLKIIKEDGFHGCENLVVKQKKNLFKSLKRKLRKMIYK